MTQEMLYQPSGPDGEVPQDTELSTVAAELKRADPDGTRIAKVLRRTYNMLLDGQNTGRYRWDELHKTEKTHFGTLIEINLQRQFDFADGDAMDFAICGIDVDCKFSQKLTQWMIPPEAVGHLILGVWADDDRWKGAGRRKRRCWEEPGRWSVGLVRASEEHLRPPGRQRDSKRQLNDAGKDAITWLFQNAVLPENVLLRIPPDDEAAIFSCRQGQPRVNEIFRRVQGRLITRAVVATLAMQYDYQARVRDNGHGARTVLRPEGIVIFGEYSSHAQVARALGLPVPADGEFVSARLVRRMSHHGAAPHVILDGQEWVIALPDDPLEVAPKLPTTLKKPKAT